MTSLRADELEAIRATVDQFLPDPATVARTGATINIRLYDQPRLYPIEHGIKFHSYTITADRDADVVPGDVLTLGSTSFAIQETDSPRSYPVQLRLVGIPTSLLLASNLAPEAAVFQHPQQLTKTVSAEVFATQRTADMQAYGDVLLYPWLIVYENTVRYEGGGMIGANHRLRLASIFGTDGSGMARAGIISQPRPLLHGLPFMAALVKEPSA